ncbi:MAG TPA: S8 family serine peptidase [Candidatus Binatia bacterium]|nr:S8 family serine peptidase [Candidatus Binatia bacterium]
MNGTIKLVAPLIAALAIAACSSGGSSMPAAGSTGQSALTQAHGIVPDWLAKGQARPVCPQVTGRPTCLALTQRGIQPECTGATCGWAPIDLQTRYKLPITKGSGQIVAIIDAGDNPSVATSLSTYRTTFGLGTANFKKYNQSGQQSNYPTYTGWSVEIALDVEMVSATCPLCTIYLVEANSSSSTDLDTAELEAVTLGAHIVSNSWICYGSISCVTNSDFDQPGVVYTAGSGDAGYGQNGAPEALDTVVSVGGTQLAKSGSTYTETIWNGAGGGCATGETKPSWQHDPSCTSRTDSDVSAEAGCSPGVSVYDQYDGGWGGVCGTSAATPMAAAIFGLAGNASSQDAGKKFWSLNGRHRNRDLHPILVGNDGSCGGSYLCTAGTHQDKTYSGPGGWGSPKGIGAF